MNQLKLQIEAQEALVDSRWLADALDLAHHEHIRLIRKYESHLNDFGVVRFETRKPQKGSLGGRPEEYALLNEDQATFLLTLSRNSDKVVLAKKAMTKAFGKMRRQAEVRAEELYQQNRASGKLIRREETDTIRDFLRYATDQGSKNAKFYYTTVTKATYSALFFLEGATKWEGIRDLLDAQQLSTLSTAEQVARKAIKEGMSQQLHYKTIYQLAKDRLMSLGHLLPKSTAPAQLEAK
jgi:phage regulator Rha-like protein